MVGIEAGGRSLDLGEHAARFSGGKPGVLHGTYTYVLQDADGMIAKTHSVSAGLDYPAVGPSTRRSTSRVAWNILMPETRKRWRRRACWPARKESSGTGIFARTGGSS